MSDRDPDSDTFYPLGVIGEGVLVGRRICGDRETFVRIEPLPQGVPLAEGEEVVRLHRGRAAGELRVESLGMSTKGPAKYNSRSYRKNYDSIFGAKHKPAVN